MSSSAKALAAVVLAALAAWFLMAPHLVVNRMREAAREHDAAKLSNDVDFPALKDSLKSAFSTRLAARADKEKGSSPFAALGTAVAAAFVDPMIDAMVTPGSLEMLLNGARPEHGKLGQGEREPSGAEVDLSMAYEDIDSFVVSVRRKGDSGKPVEFVLHREGLLTWKLAAIRLPD